MNISLIGNKLKINLKKNLPYFLEPMPMHQEPEFWYGEKRQKEDQKFQKYLNFDYSYFNGCTYF